MNTPAAGKCIVIQPGAYPVLAPATANAVARQLRDPKTAAAAGRALDEGSATLHGAAQTHIDRLQDHIERIAAAVQAGDTAGIYNEAHEVRGLAGNAGLIAAAQIAGELCRYLDALARAGARPDAAVVQLHIEAAVRAARATDEATRLGGSVAQGLAALVDKKLTEVNTLETSIPGTPV